MRFGQWWRVDRKARKQHVCGECMDYINIGQSYVHWKSVGVDEEDGKFSSTEDRVHLECQKKIEYEFDNPFEIGDAV